MRLDLLVVADRREGDDTGQSAAGDIELAVEAAGIRAKLAGGVGAVHVERRHRDDGARALRHQDLAVAGERAEPRAAVRLVIVTRGDGIEQDADVLEPQRVVGPVEEEIDLGPLDMAIEHQPDRAILRLPTAGDDVEGAVAVAMAFAR
jgi:hypothetical protein